LVICCLGPGFDCKDFELLRNTDHNSRLDKVINNLIHEIFVYNFENFTLDL